jgi:hypothetical protein
LLPALASPEQLIDLPAGTLVASRSLLPLRSWCRPPPRRPHRHVSHQRVAHHQAYLDSVFCVSHPRTKTLRGTPGHVPLHHQSWPPPVATSHLLPHEGRRWPLLRECRQPPRVALTTTTTTTTSSRCLPSPCIPSIRLLLVGELSCFWFLPAYVREITTRDQYLCDGAWPALGIRRQQVLIHAVRRLSSSIRLPSGSRRGRADFDALLT